MAVTVAPTALPAPKKNSFYSVTLTATGGTGPYTWAVSAGALPAFLTLTRINDTQATVTGKVPSTLDATTFSATITATDTLSASGACTSTTIAKAVDGPDPAGFHTAEATRSSVTTIDQIEHGAGLSVADALVRQWPSNPPAQNS